jgi:gamma-D-glutamyl-L-lysine dipeptidyl-peptidase
MRAAHDRSSVAVMAQRTSVRKARLALIPLAALTLAACGGTPRGQASRVASAAPITHAHADSAGPWRAVVDVSVATLWAKPAALRPMDAPSAANPVDIPLWLSRMTTADRRWLVGRVQTQALYGSVVTVLRQHGRWSYVAVHGQATPLDRRGYPGWLPTRQLTGNLSLVRLRASNPVAVVRARTAWLRDPVTHARRIQVSFATRLVVVGRSGAYDVVATPRGGRLAIRARSVALYRSVSAIPTPTGAAVVRVARRFLGLAYLWGGTSGFGFDCSGFTYSVYRRFGVELPRDADRQAVNGALVRAGHLRAGDLVFLAGPGGTGPIHHVAIFIGSGDVIEAPATGLTVRIIPLSALADEYAGARRYL